MNIFNKDGWVNVPLLLNQGVHHILMTGARGIGKTFGVVEDCVVTRPRPFIYMRRTNTELEAIYGAGVDSDLNPFKGFNKHYGRNLSLVRTTKYTGRIVEYVPKMGEDENGNPVPTGEWEESGKFFGICVALKSLAKIRGFDGSDFDTVFFDEFIPERHVEKIRDECTAFLNALETMGRNRELLGEPPQEIILASNANRLDNEIYVGLNLVTKVEQMVRKGQQISRMPARDILLVNILHSPISDRKRETSLYKFAAGTEFAAMALDNSYIGEEESPMIRSMPLIEFRPICAAGELTMYHHKSLDRYYICTQRTGSPPVYGTGEIERQRLRHDFRYLITAYLDNVIFFESRTCELLFCRYIGIET